MITTELRELLAKAKEPVPPPTHDELREMLAKVAPWLPLQCCGADEGACKCGLIWGIGADAVVANIVREDDDHKKGDEVFRVFMRLLPNAVNQLPSLLSAAERVAGLEEENGRLRAREVAVTEALAEARSQIEYLHEKFTATGSGNGVLARIEALLGSGK